MWAFLGKAAEYGLHAATLLIGADRLLHEATHLAVVGVKVSGRASGAWGSVGKLAAAVGGGAHRPAGTGGVVAASAGCRGKVPGTESRNRLSGYDLLAAGRGGSCLAGVAGRDGAGVAR